ncbi:MAG TPA: 3-deoxy-manno-octulosonate cytidylyltransferase [Gemmatimonadales bacterium]|nr:3-deoxy-manno-octulosonate cytidylyltransferase [Gemmatimonadales bacterium]
MHVLCVIPARLGSTRLPSKPLQPLGGVPLVVRVAERVGGLGCIDALVVATDSPKILQIVEQAGFRAVLTSGGHQTGTERVAEVAELTEFAGFDLIVNVQGDEPFVPREAVTGAIARVRAGDDVGTAAAPMSAAQASDPARVKVVLDAAGRALYFSRAAIPFVRDPDGTDRGLYWQHLGVYACRRAALLRWVALAPTPLETAERLEQLRALQHGLSFGVALLDAPVLPGIDTPEDLERAEAYWQETQGVTT